LITGCSAALIRGLPAGVLPGTVFSAVFWQLHRTASHGVSIPILKGARTKERSLSAKTIPQFAKTELRFRTDQFFTMPPSFKRRNPQERGDEVLIEAIRYYFRMYSVNERGSGLKRDIPQDLPFTSKYMPSLS
jgi:hypothetical protein